MKRSIYRSVEVEIDLDDFSTAEIMDELEKRGLDADSPEAVEKLMRDLQAAVRLNQKDQMQEIARKLVNEYFGTCL